MLSTDGSEGNAYTFSSMRWSPDSKKIVGVPPPARLRAPGALRRVVAGRSAAAEAHRRMFYRKPGDVVDFDQPVAVRRRDEEADARRHRAVPESVREHAARVARATAARSRSSTTSAATRSIACIEVDATTRQARARSSKRRSKTFVEYSSGKTLSGRDVARRQGDHLDVGARRLESPLSLRRRHRPGEEPDHQGQLGRCAASIASTKPSGRSGSARAAWTPGKDPYFIHYYRVNFDGTGLTRAHRRATARTRVDAARRTGSSTSTPGRASICRRSVGAASARAISRS